MQKQLGCALGALAVCLVLTSGTAHAGDDRMLTLEYLLNQRHLSHSDISMESVGIREVYNPDRRCFESLMVYKLWLGGDCRGRKTPLLYRFCPNVGKQAYIAERLEKVDGDDCRSHKCRQAYLVKRAVRSRHVNPDGFDYLLQKRK